MIYRTKAEFNHAVVRRRRRSILARPTDRPTDRPRTPGAWTVGARPVAGLRCSDGGSELGLLHACPFGLVGLGVGGGGVVGVLHLPRTDAGTRVMEPAPTESTPIYFAPTKSVREKSQPNSRGGEVGNRPSTNAITHSRGCPTAFDALNSLEC